VEFRAPVWAGIPGCVRDEGLPAAISFDVLTGTVTGKSRRVNLTDLPSISVIWIETVMVISPLRKLRKARPKGVAAVTETGYVFS
jgi:hypothetical protein